MQFKSGRCGSGWTDADSDGSSTKQRQAPGWDRSILNLLAGIGPIAMPPPLRFVRYRKMGELDQISAEIDAVSL